MPYLPYNAISSYGATVVGLAQDIERLIREKESEISKLKSDMSMIQLKIEAARAYIQGLSDILPKAQKEDGRVKKAKAASPSELRAGSAPARVKELLEMNGAPLHIARVLEGIGKENTKANRIALAGTLARLVRDGSVFTRPAPNTFGLKQMDDPQNGWSEEAEIIEEVDLPDEFGS